MPTETERIKELDGKKCNVCGAHKPLTEFYFRNDRGIYRPNCKKCKPLNRMADIMKRVAEQTTKICKHCGIGKPVSEYQKAGGGKWLQPYCKPCDANRKQKYAEDNKDKVVKKRKQHYIDNKEIITKRNKDYIRNNVAKVKERTMKYIEDNIERIRLRGREYSRKNSEILKAKSRERYYSNHQRYLEKQKEQRDNRTSEQIVAKKEYDKQYKIKKAHIIKAWREKNKDKIREQRRIWGNTRAATDIVYRIKRNIRTRIRCALKPNNAYKVDTSENLLGCTISFFKQYLESLFTDGMNWGKFMSADIEIDHIKPCAKFDLTKEEDQRKCFHYTNCQPLWWYDNNKKGATYQEPKAA